MKNFRYIWRYFNGSTTNIVVSSDTKQKTSDEEEDIV